MPARKPAASTRSRPRSAKRAAPTRASSSTSTRKIRRAALTPSAPPTPASLQDQVNAILTALQRLSSKRIRDDMTARYGIPNHNAIGVAMSAMQKLGKDARKPNTPAQNHALAAALWDTAGYEARTVAAFVDDPALITSSQMDRWCRDFDSWAICDTVCFKLFDRVPPDLAFSRIDHWAKPPRSRPTPNDEFIKRAAFALLACVALHDKAASDEPFLLRLPLIERALTDPPDDRNFVKKGVSWALRSIGRRSPALRTSSIAAAERLAASPHPAARWVGNDALRELAGRRAGKSTPRPKRQGTSTH